MTHDAFFFARLREGEKKSSDKTKIHTQNTTDNCINLVHVCLSREGCILSGTHQFSPCPLNLLQPGQGRCDNQSLWIKMELRTLNSNCKSMMLYIYIYIYIYIEKCQNLLIGIWQPMIGIFPSMIGIWQPLIGIFPSLIGIWHVPLKSWNWHPSIQALSTSSRSWLGLEFSAAWTSEMRNNYGCSRTLNTVWYGVVTCGMLILASARCSKNDNRKRYAFGPCCFLQVVARICWMPAQVIFLQVSFDVAYIRDRQKNELWAMLLLHHQKLKKTLPVLFLISKMLTGIRRCLNNQICAKRVVSIQQRLIICFRPCSSWTLVQTLCG